MSSTALNCLISIVDVLHSLGVLITFVCFLIVVIGKPMGFFWMGWTIAVAFNGLCIIALNVLFSGCPMTILSNHLRKMADPSYKVEPSFIISKMRLWFNLDMSQELLSIISITIAVVFIFAVLIRLTALWLGPRMEPLRRAK